MINIKNIILLTTFLFVHILDCFAEYTPFN